MKGIQGFAMGKGEAPGDQGQAAYYLIASLYAESRDAMNAAFASPEGVAAGADVADFAMGGVTMVFDEGYLGYLVSEPQLDLSERVGGLGVFFVLLVLISY